MNVIRQGSSSASSTAGAGSAVNSASSGTSATSQSGFAASSSVRLRSSAISSDGFATCQAQAEVLPRSCSVHGNATAPRRKHAHMLATHSGRLPISVITTSPFPTPRAASAPARRALRSAISANVHARRSPSRASSIRARSPGWRRSMTSRAKFTTVFSPEEPNDNSTTTLER